VRPGMVSCSVVGGWSDRNLMGRRFVLSFGRHGTGEPGRGDADDVGLEMIGVL
jgi:hypothetical protein